MGSYHRWDGLYMLVRSHLYLGRLLRFRESQIRLLTCLLLPNGRLKIASLTTFGYNLLNKSHLRDFLFWLNWLDISLSKLLFQLVLMLIIRRWKVHLGMMDIPNTRAVSPLITWYSLLMSDEGRNRIHPYESNFPSSIFVSLPINMLEQDIGPNHLDSTVVTSNRAVKGDLYFFAFYTICGTCLVSWSRSASKSISWMHYNTSYATM